MPKSKATLQTCFKATTATALKLKLDSIMPTAKRQRRAKSAAAPKKAKEEEDDEEMAAIDKENEANGGRKGRRGSKRKPAEADDDDVGEEDEGAAGANDNDGCAVLGATCQGEQVGRRNRRVNRADINRVVVIVQIL